VNNMLSKANEKYTGQYGLKRLGYDLNNFMRSKEARKLCRKQLRNYGIRNWIT